MRRRATSASVSTLPITDGVISTYLTLRKMNTEPDESQTDVWSQWLLHTRFGNDPGHEQVLRTSIDLIADRVLGGARLCAGMALVDIGTGDGQIAFRAIDAIGPSLRVILTDISAPLLRHAETLAI